MINKFPIIPKNFSQNIVSFPIGWEKFYQLVFKIRFSKKNYILYRKGFHVKKKSPKKIWHIGWLCYAKI